MPTFLNTLPPEGANQGYQLLRTPTASPISGVITSADVIVCDTHYWRGRTTPCERQINPDHSTRDDSLCEACRMKQPWRTHVYVSAFNPKSGHHFLYECTANAAKPLIEYRDRTGSLRGCWFTANRLKPAANSKVQIVTRTADLGRLDLPSPPDIPAALAVIWRIPAAAADVQHGSAPALPRNAAHATAADNVRFSPEPLAAMHTPADNGMSPAQFEDHRAAVLEQLRTATTKKNGKQKA